MCELSLGGKATGFVRGELKITEEDPIGKATGFVRGELKITEEDPIVDEWSKILSQCISALCLWPSC